MGRSAVAVIVSLWMIPISVLVNHIVPDPYMDEIFHIPQAQQYCKGNFWNWDPMITTPPGLYIISLLHVACLFPGILLLRLVSSFSELCNTAILRSTNGVWAVLCSVLLYETITHLRPTISERKATFLAVVLALYPLHWFFTFLYYTDVPSLTVVLAMYLACLKRKYYLSALFGAFAVFMRQTNIIWVIFVACTGVIDLTISRQGKGVKVVEISAPSERSGLSNVSSRVTSGSEIRKRKFSSTTDVRGNGTTTANTSIGSAGLLHEIYTISLTSWRIKWRLLLSFYPFLMVLVGFVAFVRWNGSVVLGAKDAHAVSRHFAQILYFGLISAIAMVPFHFSIGHCTDLVKSFWRNKPLSFFQLLVALSLGFLSVHFYSIAHPYLIADNRHYPFYLWRKVVKAHWSMKYLLVPLYIYSWFSICSILRKVQERTWVLAYFLATTAVLIPAPLIEFRYYTIPFYLLALHSPMNESRSWILMGLGYMVVNAFTMWMFLFRPFSWSHEPGVQRFIW